MAVGTFHVQGMETEAKFLHVDPWYVSVSKYQWDAYVNINIIIAGAGKTILL